MIGSHLQQARARDVEADGQLDAGVSRRQAPFTRLMRMKSVLGIPTALTKSPAAGGGVPWSSSTRHGLPRSNGLALNG